MNRELDGKLDTNWTVSTECVQLLVDDGTRVIRVPRPPSGTPWLSVHLKCRLPRGGCRHRSHDNRLADVPCAYYSRTVPTNRLPLSAGRTSFDAPDPVMVTDSSRPALVPPVVASGDAP